MSALAVVPVRRGAVPQGGLEAVAEAGGRALLVGDGVAEAAAALAGRAVEVRGWDAGDFAPGAWAAALAPLLHDTALLILPASPDGRDLAPRLAAELRRPLLAGAIAVHPDRVVVARWGSQVVEEMAIGGPIVVTLEPGVRGVDAVAPDGPAAPEPFEPVAPVVAAPVRDAEVVEVLPPDVATMDLAEAPRILGGGAGLGGPDDFALLADVASALGASTGATRVVTDAGWVGHDRQIGTTGVVVDPRLYLAFGISGAVQHTSGLGAPEHIVSVNVDPHCPMMALADLAVVADAPAVLRTLAARLGAGRGHAPRPVGKDGPDA